MSGKIILVRHGEPDVKIADHISGYEISSFLDYYNNALLKRTSLPSDRLKFLAQNAVVVCSDLKRSLESACFCDVEPLYVDPIFAESIPPHFRSSQIRLSPKSWLIFSRLLWSVGFSKNGESLFEAKKRAQKATKILIDYAMHSDVILFGHGLFNILIAAELRKNNFCGKRVPARKHWEFGVYEKRV